MVFPTYNAIISTTGDNNGKLEIQVKVENNVACKAEYKNHLYKDITPTTNSLTEPLKFYLEIDEYIPFYEISCKNKPSFIYHMFNDKTKTLEENKLQYFVKKSTNSKKANYLYLKFQNSYPDEMCYFRVKSALKKDSERKWESNCDTKKTKCFAPCRFVRMKLSSAPAKIVKVLIQRAHEYGTPVQQEESATQIHWGNQFFDI